MSENVPWHQRPTEVANLFNPAYMAALLNQVSCGYETQRAEAFPFALAFVALPIVIHRSTAKVLPKTSATKLHLWLTENPEVLFEFGQRAASYAPYVREAISFGGSSGFFTFSEGGSIASKRLPKLKGWESGFSRRIEVSQALLVGKLFGKEGDVRNIFSMFGVRP
jgi:hypothetical protein